MSGQVVILIAVHLQVTQKKLHVHGTEGSKPGNTSQRPVIGESELIRGWEEGGGHIRLGRSQAIGQREIQLHLRKECVCSTAMTLP
jgi:hypothetical protein